MTELQGEQEKLNNTTKELIEEHNRKQKHIDVSFSFSILEVKGFYRPVFFCELS